MSAVRRDEIVKVVGVGGSQGRTSKCRSTLSQVLAATAKNIFIFGYGLTLGFPTLVIPDLRNQPEDASLHLTDEEVSWIGSINLITVPLGSVLSGIVSQRFGRKRSMQAITIPFLASWIIFYFADSLGWLYLSLAVTGFAGGLMEAPVVMYISEISEPRLRGILSATTPFSALFAVFVLSLIGSFVHWRTLSIISTAAPILSFIVLFFVPESPNWLIGKNRLEDTKKSLCWLRGWTTVDEIQEEFDRLVDEVTSGLKTTDVESDRRQKSPCCDFNIKNYLNRTAILPFMLITFAFVIETFIGVTTFSTYSIEIFNSFGTPIDAYYANVLLGVSQFTGILACILLISFTGKRPLVMVSTLVTSLLFGSAGLYGYFYLGLEKMDGGSHVQEEFGGSPKYGWFPPVCFIGGSFIAFLGIRILPWILIGEVFPTKIRGFASGLSTSLGYLLSFLSKKTFFNLISLFTLPGVFVLYGVIGIASLPVFYKCLPETEGWSLTEVEEHFAGYRNLIKAGKKKARATADVLHLDSPIPVNDEITKL